MTKEPLLLDDFDIDKAELFDIDEFEVWIDRKSIAWANNEFDKQLVQLIVCLSYSVARSEYPREREREGKGEKQWTFFAVVESRIKVPGNVIYGIDLNPVFKPRAIIQSQSYSSLSLGLSVPSVSTLSLLLAHVHVVSPRACSISDIYLGTSELLSYYLVVYRIIYTHIANR